MELTARNTAPAASSSSILVTFFKFLHSIVAFLLRTPQTSINPSTQCSNMEALHKLDNKDDDDDACFICMADLKVVMGRLGMEWEDDGDDNEDEESGELTLSMGDEEASMAEVKRCFDVFDENGDGFIEAAELQRVLVCLGLKEGCGLEDCKRMIWAFDENGDGVIDLGELAKLMAQISI